MSSFQKVLNRFLGQVEISCDENLNSSNSDLSLFERSRTLSKVIHSRRQRSFEVFKSASCLSCGVNEQDQSFSIDNDHTSVPISSKYFERKSSINHNHQTNFLQQNIRQKRRAKTKLIIARHGERIDALFGDSWFKQAFDRIGTYRRFHTNLPISLPYRQNFQDYQYDPPLTELGLIRSYRTGLLFVFFFFSLFLCSFFRFIQVKLSIAQDFVSIIVIHLHLYVVFKQLMPFLMA